MKGYSRKPRHAAKTTLLVVGEGADDRAFINHMKQLFCARGAGLTVKVESGDGGSAGNIINNAIRSYKSADYDQRILLLDADLPPSAAEVKLAQKANYQIILWQPQCLEGTLLEILGQRIPAHPTSQALKQLLHPQLAGHHTEASAYAALFTRERLEATANPAIAQLRQLLSPPT